MDSNDHEWLKDFSYWRALEIENGIADPNNLQAFGEERTRDWGFLKYWFRAVENNLPWINKVFFVCQRPSQLPSWLNLNCDKLRVVYHNEFVPEDFLPTFNAFVPQTFIPKISDLSENFIYCDDDMFFLNPISESRFFQDGLPKHTQKKFWSSNYGAVGPWGKNLAKNLEVEKDYGSIDIKYAPYHLPIAFNKSTCLYVIDKHWEFIHDSMIVSKFRNPVNIAPMELYCNVAKRLKKCYFQEDVYNNCKYVDFAHILDLPEQFKRDIVCFNDTETAIEVEYQKNALLEALENRFPKESKFENKI